MVSYETVRRWVNHFVPMVAADLRNAGPSPIRLVGVDGPDGIDVPK
jgi:transposase-like protein